MFTALLWAAYSMKLVNPEFIVVHTAATPLKSIDISMKAIDAYHRNVKGWNGCGYHFVIRKGGLVEVGRPIDRMGAGVEGFNSKSMHICFSGNGDLEDFTAAQKLSGAKLALRLLKEHNLLEVFKKNPMHVLGHRECNQLIPSEFAGPKTSKTCPGKKVDMKAFRLKVLGILEGEQ
jgi:N-acetylmuramoyl-L-alanine amidase